LKCQSNSFPPFITHGGPVKNLFETVFIRLRQIKQACPFAQREPSLMGCSESPSILKILPVCLSTLQISPHPTEPVTTGCYHLFCKLNPVHLVEVLPRTLSWGSGFIPREDRVIPIQMAPVKVKNPLLVMFIEASLLHVSE